MVSFINGSRNISFMKDMKEVRGFIEFAGIEKIVEKDIEISMCADMIRENLSKMYPSARVSRNWLGILMAEDIFYVKDGIFGKKIVAVYDENAGRFAEVYDKSAFKAVEETAGNIRHTTGHNIYVLQL